MSKYNISRRTAIITGAASGIGQAIAVSLAQRGCNLILTDINEGGLDETATMCQSHEVKIQCQHLDVSNTQAIRDFAESIRANKQPIDILVNNAGVALGGNFDHVSQDDFEWLLDINLHGVIRMTRAFMPILEASDDACVVNLSSIFGIIAPPGQTAYSTAKFGVRGFSEALRHELALSGSNVRVTQVHPGGIHTNIVKNARIAEQAMVEIPDFEKEMKNFEKSLVMSPAQAGEIIVRGIVNRKKRVLVGNDAHILSMIARLLPINYMSVLRFFF
ncbi:MAG: SDR family oxidoreductase [Chloroflexota bacterium]